MATFAARAANGRGARVEKVKPAGLARPADWAPGKPAAGSGTANERLLFGAQVLVGYKVEVQVKSGIVYEGIFHTLQFDGKDIHVVLKYARVVRDPNVSDSDRQTEAEKPHKTLMIYSNELVQVIAKDVKMLAEDLGPVSNEDLDGLGTDSQIGSTRRGAGIMGRELQPWVPEEGDMGLELSLEEDAHAGWDQFATNKQMFGISTTYDENLYTTRLDKQTCAISEQEAARLASEIERGPAHNYHLAEERGHVVDDGQVDEEDKYSSVIRQPSQQHHPHHLHHPPHSHHAPHHPPAHHVRRGERGPSHHTLPPPGMHHPPPPPPTGLSPAAALAIPAAALRPVLDNGLSPRGKSNAATSQSRPPAWSSLGAGVAAVSGRATRASDPAAPPAAAPAAGSTAAAPLATAAPAAAPYQHPHAAQAAATAAASAAGPSAGHGAKPTTPIDIDARKETNKIRMQMTAGLKKDRSSPYGTPKGLRSPLKSPLVHDPAQMEALDLNPGMTRLPDAIKQDFLHYKHTVTLQRGMAHRMDDFRAVMGAPNFAPGAMGPPFRSIQRGDLHPHSPILKSAIIPPPPPPDSAPPSASKDKPQSPIAKPRYPAVPVPPAPPARPHTPTAAASTLLSAPVPTAPLAHSKLSTPAAPAPAAAQLTKPSRPAFVQPAAAKPPTDGRPAAAPIPTPPTLELPPAAASKPKLSALNPNAKPFTFNPNAKPFTFSSGAAMASPSPPTPPASSSSTSSTPAPLSASSGRTPTPVTPTTPALAPAPTFTPTATTTTAAATTTSSTSSAAPTAPSTAAPPAPAPSTAAPAPAPAPKLSPTKPHAPSANPAAPPQLPSERPHAPLPSSSRMTPVPPASPSRTPVPGHHAPSMPPPKPENSPRFPDAHAMPPFSNPASTTGSPYGMAMPHGMALPNAGMPSSWGVPQQYMGQSMMPGMMAYPPAGSPGQMMYHMGPRPMGAAGPPFVMAGMSPQYMMPSAYMMPSSSGPGARPFYPGAGYAIPAMGPGMGPMHAMHPTHDRAGKLSRPSSRRSAEHAGASSLPSAGLASASRHDASTASSRGDSTPSSSSGGGSTRGGDAVAVSRRDSAAGAAGGKDRPPSAAASSGSTSQQHRGGGGAASSSAQAGPREAPGKGPSSSGSSSTNTPRGGLKESHHSASGAAAGKGEQRLVSAAKEADKQAAAEAKPRDAPAPPAAAAAPAPVKEAGTSE